MTPASSKDCLALSYRPITSEYLRELILMFAAGSKRESAAHDGQTVSRSTIFGPGGYFTPVGDQSCARVLMAEWRRAAAGVRPLAFHVQGIIAKNSARSVGNTDGRLARWTLTRVHLAMARFTSTFFHGDATGYLAAAVERGNELRLDVLLLPKTFLGVRIDLREVYGMPLLSNRSLDVWEGLQASLRLVLVETGGPLWKEPYQSSAIARWQRRHWALRYTLGLKKRTSDAVPSVEHAREATQDLEAKVKHPGGWNAVVYWNRDSVAQGVAFDPEADVCCRKLARVFRDDAAARVTRDVIASIRARARAALDGMVGNAPPDGCWTWRIPAEIRRRGLPILPGAADGVGPMLAGSSAGQSESMGAPESHDVPGSAFASRMDELRLVNDHLEHLALYWAMALREARGVSNDLDDLPSEDAAQRFVLDKRADLRALEEHIGVGVRENDNVVVETIQAALYPPPRAKPRPAKVAGDTLSSEGFMEAGHRHSNKRKIDLESGMSHSRKHQAS